MAQTTVVPDQQLRPDAVTDPTSQDVGPGDCAHIVDQRKRGNNIAEAVVEGREVTALCGYRWIPYREPKGRPVCEACVEAFGRVKT